MHGGVRSNNKNGKAERWEWRDDGKLTVTSFQRSSVAFFIEEHLLHSDNRRNEQFAEQTLLIYLFRLGSIDPPRNAWKNSPR